MAYTSVKISANSSDYQSQMKSAATQMKALSSEYSVAATKAKLFGTATDGLKAKAESLTQKITVQKDIVKLNEEQQGKLTAKLSEQKTKQEELKKKIDDAKNAYQKSAEETGKNSEQSKALKDELDKLEQEFKANETAIGKTETALANQTVKTNASKTKLMEMEAELKKVNSELKGNKLEAFANACDSAGQKIEGFGKKMSIVSAGIAGIGAASIKSFTELDEGYDTIVTKTGATGEALEGLTKSADNIFGSMPEDMSIVGEAIGEVNTRFHTTGTELETTSKQFIQFASINGTQVTQSVDQVDKIMKAWNIDSAETGNLLGLLTAKAQETGISVDSLESFVLDNNAAFKEMGLSLPQAINLMAQFDANGVDSTQALAGLKKALQTATAEGKSMDVALEETIGSIKNAKTDTEALQIATELFGKKGAAEMSTAIRENRIDLSDLSASMSEYGSVVEDTYNGTLDPIDNAKIAMNNAKLALSSMATTAQTAAAPMIEKVTTKIQDLTKWFTSLNPAQQETILKAGLMVAAVGPLAIGFGKTAQGISSTVKAGKSFVSGAAAIIAKITGKTAATAAGTAADAAGTAATAAHTVATTTATTVTGGMTAAQAALNTVMNLCPIILIVTLIAGLIAAGIALYKNWDTVKEKLSELWTAAVEKFEAIKTTVVNAVGNIKEWINGMKLAIPEIAKNALENARNAAQTAKEKIVEFIDNAKGTIPEVAKEALENARNAAKTAKEKIVEFIKNAKGTIPEVGKKALDNARNAAKTAKEKIVEFIKNAKGTIPEVGKKALDNARNAAKTAKEKIVEFIKNAKGTIPEVGKKALDNARNAAKTAKEKIVEFIKNAKGKLPSINVDVLGTAKTAVSKAIEKIKGFFNFSWSLPKIALPHFSISGSFGINPPSIPKFSVSWYKTGAIMNAPMIFGMAGNNLLAGGEPETGGEAILPLAPFYMQLNKILDQKLETIQRQQNVYVENHTYIDGDEVASRTATKVDEKMVTDKRKGR